MEPIYLDHNATTPLLPAVRAAMLPYCDDAFGNPASAHAAGRRARRALEDAREQLAALLDAGPDEVLFTSGATESNNLALFGLSGEPAGAILASPLEHPSVAEPLRRLAEMGSAVEYLPVGPTGLLAAADLRERLRPDVRLLVLQLANHETGIVQPLADLIGQARQRPEFEDRLAIHTDATQAVGKLPVRFRELGVTTLSCSAHKFHGPKGIGLLLVRRGTKVRPLLYGGHQQQGRRPGTEPVALAVGMAAALDLAHRELTTRRERVRELRHRFLALLEQQAAPVVLNGPAEGEPGFRLPHTLNLSFPGCRADALLMNLDLVGIACSTGSACSSGSLLPSPVLQAMGVPPERFSSAMRFSLSYLLTEAQIEEAARRIATVVRRLRLCG
ncbi:MAG: cysteine desulfurase [Planctomycetia bacterium]|nr:cysteine desulfurase [Planctomycetia bacterium]